MAARRCYELFGRTLRSAIELPELATTIDEPGVVDFDFALGIVRRATEWRDYSTLEDGTPWIQVAESADRRVIRFPDLAVFEVHRNGATIVGAALADAPELTVRHLLIDQVIPTLIGWNGTVALHGGAVAVGEHAVALLGLSGIGKSTLVASFGLDAGAILTDDCIVIEMVDGRYAVRASYPSIRLHPSAADVLVPDDPGRPVAHYNVKRRFSRHLRSAATSVPLAGVLTIIDAPIDDQDLIQIHPLTGQRAFLELMDARFAPLAANAAALLDGCAQVAAHCDVGRITVPNDFEALPAVRAAIERWIAEAHEDAFGR